MGKALIISKASNASFGDWNSPELYDAESFSVHDTEFPVEVFARRPVADELLYLQTLALMGLTSLRVRNDSGVGMSEGDLVYVSAFTALVEEGDASTQLSSWSIDGATFLNTSKGRLFWTLSNSGTTRTVNIYNHQNQDGTYPTEALVATGNRSGDGAITLSEQNSSGISGSVTVAYTADDTDSANILYLNVFDVTLADADDSTKLAEFVLGEDIADAAYGYAHRFIEITGLDTSGAGSVGDAAYLSGTAGAFAWSVGAKHQRVGWCTLKDATDGKILFMLPGRHSLQPDDVTLEMNSSTHRLQLTDGVADEILTASLSVGAEGGSDDIIVTIQIKDAQGNNLSKEVLLECWVADSATGWECSTAPDGGVSVTTGVAADVLTAGKRLRLITTAGGAGAVQLIDSGTPTYYLRVKVGDKVYTSGAITFA